jgi:hypothetical protein
MSGTIDVASNKGRFSWISSFLANIFPNKYPIAK